MNRNDQRQPRRYFALLRRFVDDLAERVLEPEREIYQYPGDEVVVTCPIEVGRPGAPA